MPIFLDIEASGFGQNSYPIEIAWGTSAQDISSTLVAPSSDWTHWDVNAASLHGLTRDELVASGKPIHSVASLLRESLSGKKVYSDAYRHNQQ